MPAAAITANASSAEPRWLTQAVLDALAARNLAEGDEFTRPDLLAWAPDVPASKLKQVTTRLCSLGYVQAGRHTEVESARSFGTYRLTAEGAAAVEAVRQGHRRTSGPKGPHTVDRAVPVTSFAYRLWTLMRARKLLDSDTAASLLVDAGGDVAKATRTAARYLLRWSRTGAIAESAQRVNAQGSSNGNKRYVLINDCGPTPPAWTEKARARRKPSTASTSK